MYLEEGTMRLDCERVTNVPSYAICLSQGALDFSQTPCAVQQRPELKLMEPLRMGIQA